MQTVDVVIQGAGIAGLALARMLQQHMSVIVLDQRDTLDSSGAGILVQENAILALSHLGIDVYPFVDATTISHINMGSVQYPEALRVATAGKARAMPRARLLRALSASLDFVSFYLGVSIKAWQQDSDKKITIELDDQRRIRCRWLIAADGIHSSLREDVQGFSTAFRATGQYCWRVLVDDVAHNHEAYEVHAGALRFGVIPTGARQVYLYVVSAEIDAKTAAGWCWQEIKTALQQGGKLFSGLAEYITPSSKILFHPLIDAPVYMPVHLPIILMGDAAHPMTPNLGQGAAMALEDAVILGYLLQDKNNPDPAQAFYNVRQKRITTLSRSSFYAGAVAHWKTPWVQQVKTLGLRLLPTGLFKFQQYLFANEFHRQINTVQKKSSSRDTLVQ